MWTWVIASADVAVENGFAVGDEISWSATAGDLDDDLPPMPADFDGIVEHAEDEDGDVVLEGVVSRILMLTGRRRTRSTEISATPAEHVQVLDIVGFLVEVGPPTT